jgi:hypothetical protein
MLAGQLAILMSALAAEPTASEMTLPPPDSTPASAATPALVPPPAPPLEAPTPPPESATERRSFPPDLGPFRIENPNGSLRLGLLLQPQYQSLGENTYSGQGQNLYLRRARVMLGATIFSVVEFFFDIDYPNLFIGKAASGTPTVKYTPTANIQDAFLTYRPFGDLFMVDAGYFLPPMAHNTLQSAATLFGLDFFEYSFQHDQAFGTQSPITTSVGRDTGVELRGLLFGQHLEYRVGMFQGLRGAKTTSATGSENSFRVTGRIQINFLDPERGFFYAGTYLGTKRILSIGGSYDFQNSLSNDYQYFAGDAFLDLPVGPGIVTAQVNVAHWNGHDFIPMVPVAGQAGIVLEDQTAVMGEAGFTFIAVRLSPIGHIEHIEGPNLPPQNRYGGGLAFWHLGYNSNLKVSYTRITQAPPPPPAVPYHSANELQLQWQAYFF